jgi:hypothetical protein
LSSKDAANDPREGGTAIDIPGGDVLTSNAAPPLDRPNLPRIEEDEEEADDDDDDDDGGGDGGTASVAGKPAIIPNPSVGVGFRGLVCRLGKGKEGAGDETLGAA